ncbi:MAG: hypothetical protein LBI29_02005 [Rickettsiales bacterium]|jgi:hypothetical protein|nr:hypothetical protein [Rickettsiales bacterium]
MGIEGYDRMGRQMAGYAILARFFRCVLIFLQVYGAFRVLRGSIEKGVYSTKQITNYKYTNVILRPVLQINEKSTGFVYITSREATKDSKQTNILQMHDISVSSDNFIGTAARGHLDLDKNEITLFDKPTLIIRQHDAD